jgi:hypothetical protein
MSTTTFESARVGDKVYSTTLGWGVIEYIKPRDNYPIHVSFPSINGEVVIFTYEGYFYDHVPIQSLFWGEVVFEVPVKRKTKLINGIEIPDITFKPTLNEYYYTPMPNYPELYHLMMDFHSNRLTNHLSENNLCYPFTEEGRQAAILHAKAMLNNDG